MDRTRVYFTVDTEAAEERVAGERMIPAQGYDLRVWCRFRNRQDELGIGLITRELEAHGFFGTFFVEVFGSYFFGIGGAPRDLRAPRGRRARRAAPRAPGAAERRLLEQGRRARRLDDLADYDIDAQAGAPATKGSSSSSAPASRVRTCSRCARGTSERTTILGGRSGAPGYRSRAATTPATPTDASSRAPTRASGSSMRRPACGSSRSRIFANRAARLVTFRSLRSRPRRRRPLCLTLGRVAFARSAS